MTTIEKAQIAAEIKAFNNTDFSDCPELTDEQLAQLRPSHYRKTRMEQSDEVSVTFSLKKELADRLPKDHAELQAYINKLLEQDLNSVSVAAQTLRAIKSPARAEASRENGKKGGRPRKQQNPTI
jgi:hypothetical protein